MFGFLNIYKPKGKTSHDVVAVLRRITKIKQIGHTGTLDPFAEGVLPICIGKSTRLIEYLKDDKAYVATVKLGASTTTYDLEGEVVNTSSKIVSLKEIEPLLKSFSGEIEQYPPIYSAIKVNGKKLYDYARKGEEVEIKPRKVVINEIKITDFDEKSQVLELYIACSKGTYIRSVANDLGEKLGTFAHLIKLVRVQAGDFTLKNSISLEQLDSLRKVEENLQNPIKYLSYPNYKISSDDRIRVTNGNSIEVSVPNGTVILIDDDKIIAIGDVENNIFKCKKVFI